MESNPPQHVARPQARPVYWVVAALVALVTLEASLQALAFSLWVVNRPAGNAAPSAHAAVLCVGDSYTFGIGASDGQHSYPAQLSTALARHGEVREVVNGGWPGRNSRELVETFASEIDRTAPALVYVLVGTNDLWTRPSRLTGDVATRSAAGFWWRWRTPRLVSLAGVAMLRLAGRGPAITSDAGATDERPADVRRPPRQPDAQRLLEARAESDDAIHLAAAAHRTEAGVKLGALLDKLVTSEWDPDLGEVYLRTATVIGENEQALRIARELAARHPDDPEFHRVLAWALFQRHDAVAAQTAIAMAAEHSRTMPAEYRALVLRQRALIWFADDRMKALEAGIESHLVSPDAGEMRLLFQRDMPVYTPAAVTAVLEHLAARMPIAPRARQDVMTLLAQARQTDTTVTDTLESHLRLLHGMAQARGAQVVLLSYPFPSVANTVLRRTAQAAGLGWIDIETAFANALIDTPRDALYVADGHLTDRGYGIVADLVAADAVSRLRNMPAPPPIKARWLLDLRGEGNHASLRESGESLAVDVQQVGTTNLWDVQLRRTRLALEQGVSYSVSFRARAVRERHLAFGVNDHTFQSIGLFDEVIVGTEWQTFRRTFVATHSDAAAELHLDVGAFAVPVELDNVRLVRASDGVEILPNAP